MGDKVKQRALLIGDLAAATGASRRSLRHYEAKGLIRSSRQPNGYRAYDAGTVETVGRIRRLLDAGFNLDTVRAILPCLADGADAPLEMCPTVAAHVRASLARLEQEAADVARRRRVIERLVGSLAS